MSLISACHPWPDGRRMFVRHIPTVSHGLAPGNMVEIIGIREYDAYEAALVVDWLAERAAGYPLLKKFEGGANWPRGALGLPEPCSIGNVIG